jgi:membrane protein DedA with SNARE-associated domain
MGSHAIQQLLHHYGLALVFAAVGLQALGAPLPGTTVLIAAAVYAGTSHGLPIGGVIAAGALGALVGTTGGYAVGRWRGEAVLISVARRLRQSPERVQALRYEFAAHGGAWLFIGRWVTGVRNVTGLLTGSSGMGSRRFLSLTAASALLWATVVTVQYYWFGDALAAADTWLQVVLIGSGVAWMVISLNLLRRRALRRIQRAPSASELL